MHAVSHSLAQRAPGARARVRWQPYVQITSWPSASSSFLSSSGSSRSSPASASSTPASSTKSISPASSCDSDRSSHVQQPPRIRDRESQSQKNKFVVGLVDQAVKSLCDIWKPQDIPAVFVTPTLLTDPKPKPLSRSRTLPHISLASSPILSSAASTASSSSSSSSRAGVNNQAPLRGFVHEVLRRSRTSGNVLQTALCYLEAIRPQVPDLVAQEKLGLGKSDNEDRIIIGDPAEYSEVMPEPIVSSFDIEIPPAPAPMDIGATTTKEGPIKPSVPLPPLPPLPSPLLCPRRAFLASLILASKFTQDKCYSNRAWAKLSGLPAREIGRCERALGQALGWRLWVGKQGGLVDASTEAIMGPTVKTQGRPVIRSRSDADVLRAAAVQQQHMQYPQESATLAIRNEPPTSEASSATPTRPVRRSSTLPASSFRPPQQETEYEASSSHLAYEPMLSQFTFPLTPTGGSSIGTTPTFASMRNNATPTPSAHHLATSLQSFALANSYRRRHHNHSPTSTPGLSYSPSSSESDESASESGSSWDGACDHAIQVDSGFSETEAAFARMPFIQRQGEDSYIVGGDAKSAQHAAAGGFVDAPPPMYHF